MNAAAIAAVLGDARREGRAWRCRCAPHVGRSLVIRDGNAGRTLAVYWAGCDRRDVLAERAVRRQPSAPTADIHPARVILADLSIPPCFRRDRPGPLRVGAPNPQEARSLHETHHC
jgi:hypothetical protein